MVRISLGSGNPTRTKFTLESNRNTPSVIASLNNSITKIRYQSDECLLYKHQTGYMSHTQYSISHDVCTRLYRVLFFVVISSLHIEFFRTGILILFNIASLVLGQLYSYCKWNNPESYVQHRFIITNQNTSWQKTSHEYNFWIEYIYIWFKCKRIVYAPLWDLCPLYER